MSPSNERTDQTLTEAPSASAREKAIALLRLWRTGNEEEQRETLNYLMKVLDEDRLSYRKLFE